MVVTSDLEKAIEELKDKNNQIFKEIEKETKEFYLNDKRRCQENTVYVMYITTLGIDKKIVDNRDAEIISTNITSARYYGLIEVINPRLNDYGIGVLQSMLGKASNIGKDCRLEGIDSRTLEEFYDTIREIDTTLIKSYINLLEDS